MLQHLLEQRLFEAVAGFMPGIERELIQVRPASDPRFGDYQSSSLIAVAKRRRTPPRELAAEAVKRLEVQDWCETVEVAGAGFLNFRLKAAAVAQALRGAVLGEHLFYERSGRARTVVIDFSSPNVAKPMHVGHIRSTILGDSLARCFRLLGHRVITDNHIGDWGTQFGMLLHQVVTSQPGVVEDPERFRLDDLEAFYREAKRRFDEDPSFAEASRRAVVALQSGDRNTLRLWQVFCQESMRHSERIYRRLGVRFDFSLGESFYNSRLEAVVKQLLELGIARESEGATVVFFEDNPELKAHPAIIRKRDGGFNYTTTDLATLEYRMENWDPDEIVYVTDARQQLHFKQLFEIFRRSNPEAAVQLVHVLFGSILGDDGKPLKTRSGENIKLEELLDEAEERAYQVAKNPDLTEAERREVARVVGLGAIKYADLLPNRQSDYVFNWEKMLALAGNTAPYLQYAYARIRSIQRKLETSGDPAGSDSELVLAAPEELALAKQLLKFGVVLEAMAAEYRPNYLCNYLYDLAVHFARFYESCPVLKAGPAERPARLALCELTGRVLGEGLNVLGIETLDQM